MKMNILILLTLLFSIETHCQRIEKSTLQKLINKSRVEKQNGKFSHPSDKTWYFQNADSLYYKRDTITAIQYKSAKHKSMCETISWTYYKKNNFILGRQHLCKEPPQISVTKYPNDYYSIVIYNTKDEIETIIDVKDYNKIIMESFKVLSVEENEEFVKVKLARRFNSYKPAYNSQ